MDDSARAIFDKPRDTLERVRDVEVVQHRSHDDDALTRWRAGMPKNPEPAPTAADVVKMIEAYRCLTTKAAADVLHEIRQQLRAEFAGSLATLRKTLNKAVADDRTQARHDLNRQRADHDRRLSSAQARIEELQTTIAALELRMRGMGGDRGAEIIDLPALPTL